MSLYFSNFAVEMIPKRIHYCWFGGGKMPKMIRECIATWHKHMPDWEYVLWDIAAFSNLPAGVDNPLKHPYVQSAWREQKWAFMTDYVRFWAVYHFGGVYLDTDMYVVKPLDELLDNPFFTAWGTNEHKLIDCTCYGAEKGHNLCLTLMMNYDEIIYTRDAQASLVLPHVVTPVILANKESCTIYSYDYFYPYSYEDKQLGERLFKKFATPNTYAIHLWNMGWKSCWEIHFGQFVKQVKHFWGIQKKLNIISKIC